MKTMQFSQFALSNKEMQTVKGGNVTIPATPIVSPEEKVVEKATSGLKDTLKTQV